MKKVITYGTYDLLHYGHVRLLERAKALGDYLIVGVTADDFDKTRGKINVQQSLSERIEAVRATGVADEIIVEEYEGQKIDDIRRYDVDIFTVGSDWEGTFDYLNEFCQVIYLPRTEGVSSSEIRNEKRALALGIVGNSHYLNKIAAEADFVNGISLSGLWATDLTKVTEAAKKVPLVTDDYEELLDKSDAVYIHSLPRLHYEQVKTALMKGRHVMCEAPIAMTSEQCAELYALAREKNCVLIDALRTAYATAYNRLILLVKSGKIGDVVSVDATCTSLKDISDLTKKQLENTWNSVTAWGPTALLPIFQILGSDYCDVRFASHFVDEDKQFDAFTKVAFIYPNAVASLKVGTGVKSEGELIISGTKGYIYVPAPWWKTDYFEIRYENQDDNKRYFYQLDGEGIRYQLADFAKSIEKGRESLYITEKVSTEICKIMEAFIDKKNLISI